MKQRTFSKRTELNTFLFNNPTASAATSKSIRRPRKDTVRPEQALAYATSRSQDLIANEAVQSEFGKMFFDLDIAVEILIGLILSPKGSVRPELVYRIDSDNISAAVGATITSQIATYLDKTYKLSNGLAPLLKKVMYSKGAVARIIIPENVVDKIIAGVVDPTIESLSTIYTPQSKIPLLGFLGNPVQQSGLQFGFEGFTPKVGRGVSVELEEFGLTITDNVHLLKEPKLRRAITTRSIESIGSPFLAETDSEWQSVIHGSVKTSTTIDVRAVVPDRKSIGTPLYLEVDSNVIIPIHVPGSPKQHISYMCILDERGYIITPRNTATQKAEIDKEIAGSKLGKSLVDTAKRNLSGFDSSRVTPDQIVDIFINQVEGTIKSMAAAGSYKDDLEFSSANAVYVTMLSRALSAKKTRLLFLPSSMVAYYALRYDDNGCGVTFLHDLPTLSSMRASLLFSGLVSEVRNNIPQTKVNIKLDEADPDPDASLNIIIGSALEKQASAVAMGLVDVTDWVDWAHRAGFSFQVEEHPMLPNTRIDYEDVTSSRTSPYSSTLADSIRGQQIMAIGVTPEMVDNGFASDFASTDQAKRIQLARRVTNDQMAVTELVTGEIRKLAMADGNVWTIVETVINRTEHLESFLTDVYLNVWKKDKELAKRRLISDVVRQIAVDLPSPDTDNLTVIAENIGKYREALDMALDAWISSDFISGSTEGTVLVENIDKIRAAIRAYYMREYMTKNGYLRELGNMVSFNDKDNPTIDLHEEMRAHIQGLKAMSEGYIKDLQKYVEDGETPPTDGADVIPPMAPVENGDTIPVEEVPVDETVAEDTPPATGDDTFIF